MSKEQRDQQGLLRDELMPMNAASCEFDAEGHCITCSDEALQVRVLRVDQDNGIALVAINDTSEEIDITLVEGVGPGDVLLVHGGVAIANLESHAPNDAHYYLSPGEGASPSYLSPGQGEGGGGV